MQHPDPTGAAVVVMAAVMVCLYFLPAIIAFGRKHNSRVAILVLNLLLGWSVLGWIIALVWSLTGDTKANRQRDAMVQAALINNRFPRD